MVKISRPPTTMRLVVLVLAGLASSSLGRPRPRPKERKRGYLRGVGNIFRNKASTQRNRALKHLAKLDREVAAMKSERAREQARNRKIREREGRAARAADEAAGERADEEENQEADKDRRRLSVFSASARRKRAAGHLRQVEKKHAHDPHPGVTGELEYDHPVSYAVAVAKKHAAEAAAPALRLRGGRA